MVSAFYDALDRTNVIGGTTLVQSDPPRWLYHLETRQAIQAVMANLERIHTDKAPTYSSLESFTDIFSQAIRHGDTVYVTGQSGVDPATDQLVSGGIREESRQTLENISAILEAAGTSLENVVQADIFLADFEYYDAFNEVYAEYFSEPYPARAAVKAELGMGALVEVEVIAAI